MKKIHCSLAYHEMALDEVSPFAQGVKTGYYGNVATFPVLNPTEAAFTGLISDYDSTRTAYINGGESQKGAFLLAKAALMEGLDTLAGNTDKVALGNPDIIILAGFTPTKTKGEGSKPGQCVVTVERGIAGELVSSCAKVDGAKHYGCIMVEGGQLPEGFSINADGRLVWQKTDGLMGGEESKITGIWIDLTDQRVKHFTGLKHDAVYYFYYYAVNATGVGPLSEVVSIVCW